MSLFDKVREADDWLIDYIFQPIAWRIEYYTGKNNFWCARAVLVLWPAAGSTLQFTYLRNPYLILLGGMCLAAGTLFWASIRLEKTYDQKRMNPLRQKALIPRVGTFANSCIGACIPVLGLLGHLGFASIACCLYLLACSPMPPKWQEEREKKKAQNLQLSTG